MFGRFVFRSGASQFGSTPFASRIFLRFRRLGRGQFGSGRRSFASAQDQYAANSEAFKRQLTQSTQKAFEFFSRPNVAKFVGYTLLIQFLHDYTVLIRCLDGRIASRTWRTNATGEALAEFYEAHDLLEVMMPCPPVFKFVLDQVVWDQDPPQGLIAAAGPDKPMIAATTADESRCYVKYVGMEVGFEITQEEHEDGFLMNFSRKERFINYIPLLADIGIKIKLADSKWEYGFRRLNKYKEVSPGSEDQYDVFHRCEEFSGFFPFRYAMLIHHKYVCWACRRVHNYRGIFVRDPDNEEAEAEHRLHLANVPWYQFRKWVRRWWGKYTFLHPRGIWRFEKHANPYPIFDPESDEVPENPYA